MNVTIYFRFVAAVTLFGISFYFLSDFLDLTREYLPTSGTYFGALIFLWGILPAIVLFISGIRLVIAAQKR